MVSAAKIAKRTWTALPSALCVFAAVAAILRLTVRDRVAFVAPVVYATPPCVLSAALFVAGVLWFLRRENRRMLAALAFAIAAQCWWAAGAFVLNPPPEGKAPSAAVRGVFWNLRRGAGGWEEIASQVRDLDPDVGWFVEAAEPGGATPWLDELRGYESRELGGGLVVIARGKILETRTFDLDGRGRAAEFRFWVKESLFRAVVVDFPSSAFRSRRPQFEALLREVTSMRDLPEIVAGDFNTPRDSVFFEPLRMTHLQAFETAGRGYDATWPIPFPMLSIDQVWVLKGFTLRSCHHAWSSTSDHRPVVVEVVPAR
ncbi:MAG: endonuclease/exonuclease/phosphatase family protein [Planctomycetes bacterium]|nr:endonuclease/exonuclease/phosphatase family protein [Planctomycetota bacterium]